MGYRFRPNLSWAGDSSPIFSLRNVYRMYSPAPKRNCDTRIAASVQSKTIRKKRVIDPNQMREQEETVFNDNGHIQRQFRIHTTPMNRRTRNNRHVSFEVSDVPLSTTIDRMPTPFAPEIQFINNAKTPRRKRAKRNVSRKQGSKKERNTPRRQKHAKP